MKPSPEVPWFTVHHNCPRLAFSFFEFIFGSLSVIGLVLAIVFSIRFSKIIKRTVYPNHLISYDFLSFMLYLWIYTFTALVMYSENNFLAQLRSATSSVVLVIKHIYEILTPIILLYYVIEQFLWTCLPRTRLSWSVFTTQRNKKWMSIVTFFFVLIAGFVMDWYLMINKHLQFCEVFIAYFPHEHLLLQIFDFYHFQWLVLIVLVACLILAFYTLHRLPLVGRGEKAVSTTEEAYNLTVHEVPQETSSSVKRTISCLMVVNTLFLVHTIYWLLVVNPSYFHADSDIINSMNWEYDAMNVIFSFGRLFAYYVICVNEQASENRRQRFTNQNILHE